MNDPLEQSRFAADVQDISHYSGTHTVEFTLKKGDTAILEETYSPDQVGYVYIRGLADVFSTALYGELLTGRQTYAHATFTILLDRTQAWKKEVYSMRLGNPADPTGQKCVMAVADETECHPGTPFLVTVIGSVSVSLLAESGAVVGTKTIGADGAVTTVDCDPAVLFPTAYRQGSRMGIGSEMTAHIGPALCDSGVCVRFLNRYDMPETLCAQYLSDKPAVEGSTALMYGRCTRFTTKNTTEYTLHSGRLPYAQMLDTWTDLLTARRTQLLWHGRWVDVTVTKGNWTRRRQPHYGTEAQVSFQVSNPQLIL